MSEFKERWDCMTVVERIAYIRADWARCRKTDDPLVLRIASAVAHAVCGQAANEIERLRAERDAARRQVCEMCEANGDFAAERQAEMRGWDCFKEAAS